MRLKSRYIIKALLLIAYFLVGVDQYYERFSELGLSVKGILFAAILSLCLLFLIFTSYIKNHVFRVICGIILFVSSIVLLSYEDITSSFFTYHAFISLTKAAAFAGDSLSQFRYQVISAITISLLLLVAIAIRPAVEVSSGSSRNRNFIGKVFIFSPFVAIAILVLVFFMRGGHGGKGLHSPFIPLAYASLAVYEAAINKIGERQGVEITRVGERVVDHDIVLVIDESIAPGYLDINSNFGIKTNLKGTAANVDIFNYGYAAAIANCSYESNLTLRFGGTREQYSEMIYTMPSIWQYAKSAGLNTVYIDAQVTGMKFQNGMTVEEKKYIDEFFQFENIPVIDRDKQATAKLIEKINDRNHDFIIINKVGGHFPVHDKYPDSFEKYQPALARGNFIDIVHTGARKVASFSGSPEDWVLYRNSYRNTLLWNVGEFFKAILAEAELANAVIVYTSDHGQDLHEDNRKGVNTHCSPEPVMDEGMVPLLVIQGESLKTLDWAENFTANKHQVSHYNIFPTLLSLMAYEKDEVERIYGKSLFSFTDDDLTFNVLFHARLGQKPKWKKIRPEDIVTPPELLSRQNSGIPKLTSRGISQSD